MNAPAPSERANNGKAVALSGWSLLKNEGAVAWKMVWPKGNPTAANLFNIIACLRVHEGVRLRVVAEGFPQVSRLRTG